ncbi:hypothetical protein AB0N77_04520 [Streptomyces misionensis]|uniref:hypothetical protein n=2 Tax=Streptomyces misionensis TaxID=67331 RepID=UPI003436665E
MDLQHLITACMMTGVGIDVELHSARPARNWEKSRATFLRGSHGHGDALADALGALHYLGVPGRLTAVDLYGDTVMNEQQAEAALAEVPGLREQCTDERQRAALDDLAAVLRECVNTAGSYVRFAGD